VRRPGRARVTGALSALLLATGAARAQTQAPVTEPERLPALGRTVAGTDDTYALVLNPANLGFLPAAELRWQGIYLDENLHTPTQGHAFTFGLPLPFSFATAIRLDLVDPPTQAFGGGFSQNYQWLTWGLAYAPSESMSLGFSLQRSYSSGPLARSLGSYTIGLSSRPIDQLGLSFVASHINGPLEGGDVRRLAQLGAPNVSLGPSGTAALAIRPFETRAVELGVEARYLLEPSVWEPRGVLGVDVPWVGRVQGEFSIIDPGNDQGLRTWKAAATLAIHLNARQGSTEIEGGALTGTGLGQSGSYNFVNSMAFRGFRDTAGLEVTRYAVRLRIEDTPGVRGHVAFLRALWKYAEDPQVDAVVFELRASPANSLAHVEELRDAVLELRRHGKRTLCHLEDASGAALYLCSAANRTLINPAGGLRFAGLRTRHFYFKGLLDKIGVKADFVRIGPHKSAPEQFTREGASDVARKDKIDLLQQYERRLVADIAAGRDIPVEELRRRIATGPFVANEALKAGLVDGVAFDDEIESEVERLVGRGLTMVEPKMAPTIASEFAKQPSVAVVYVEGDMIDGRSRTIPLLGMKLAGSYTIADTLQDIRKSPRIRAVVLRVETPGGSSMAADVMWREILLTAKKKPVIVSMGTAAASGGYYISAPATRIFANPLTITGSIGIFYGKADVSGLLRKLGVNVEVYKTSQHADAESFFRPFTDEEREELQHKVGQFYDVFLARVAEGRKMTKDAVDAVGQGRVWTGTQAAERGLVDEIGGLRQALAYARSLAHLPDDAPIVELPVIERSLLGRILGIDGIHGQAQHELPIPPGLVDAARAMAPFLVHRPDRPLARMQSIVVEP
jgi:protease-4